MSGPRFTASAAARLRDAIREAGGNEVFAIGDLDDRKRVADLTVTCRGQVDRVTALVDRPSAGQAVIHNHPSGDLTPSDADLHLASLYGEDGVGVVIVDSLVTRDRWVVEPHRPVEEPVDDAALEAFFTGGLPRALPHFEPRPQQLEMARSVAAALSDAHHLAVEAGTGTGKSLAYLAPAALWALANRSKVVVSTFTKALQSQLQRSDLPLLHKGGISVRTAVLLGRNNYVCKRRLGLADEEDRANHPSDRADLDALLDWEQSTTEGTRADVPLQLDAALWERVQSDSDLSLRVRCPHYETCHYYRARRTAAAAHVVVVNHALMLADLKVRADAGRGLLPQYGRAIVDEAHHLEDAATGAAEQRLSALMVRRAVLPLLDGRRRRGAITRLCDTRRGPASRLGVDEQQQAELLGTIAATAATVLADDVRTTLDVAATLTQGRDPVRITPAVERDERWRLDAAPAIRHAAALIESANEALDALASAFDDVELPDALRQPLLDLRRGHRRLTTQAVTARAFLTADPASCRSLTPAQGRRPAAIAIAPIDVGPTLQRVLWGALDSVVATSATLTVAGQFGHWRGRAGMEAGETQTWPSPFDHARQAMLALPRDLPPPNEQGFLGRTSEVLVDAIRASDGGCFVLCTSHAAVQHYARALREALGGGWPLLVQGTVGRGLLLQRFRDNPRAILVGTDSFWEGVSVRGRGLRLVAIPRLPFRVPTEPLKQARHEQIAARGGNPFRQYALPEAVLRLRQGYGRLIRSHTDRGVVLILDRRLHDRSYGQIMLRSLPPARRVKGPWRRVLQELQAALDDGAAPRG